MLNWKPILGTNLLEFSIGKDIGALKGVRIDFPGVWLLIVLTVSRAIIGKPPPRLESTHGTGVDPTQPLTLTLSPTPTRNQRGPETARKRGCAALIFFFITPKCDITVCLLTNTRIFLKKEKFLYAWKIPVPWYVTPLQLEPRFGDKITWGLYTTGGVRALKGSSHCQYHY